MMWLTIDGKEYPLYIRELLDSSKVFTLWDEVKRLTEETWGECFYCGKEPFNHAQAL